MGGEEWASVDVTRWFLGGPVSRTINVQVSGLRLCHFLCFIADCVPVLFFWGGGINDVKFGRKQFNYILHSST